MDNRQNDHISDSIPKINTPNFQMPHAKKNKGSDADKTTDKATSSTAKGPSPNKDGPNMGKASRTAGIVKDGAKAAKSVAMSRFASSFATLKIKLYILGAIFVLFILIGIFELGSSIISGNAFRSNDPNVVLSSGYDPETLLEYSEEEETTEEIRGSNGTGDTVEKTISAALKSAGRASYNDINSHIPPRSTNADGTWVVWGCDWSKTETILAPGLTLYQVPSTTINKSKVLKYSAGYSISVANAISVGDNTVDADTVKVGEVTSGKPGEERKTTHYYEDMQDIAGSTDYTMYFQKTDQVKDIKVKLKTLESQKQTGQYDAPWFQYGNKIYWGDFKRDGAGNWIYSEQVVYAKDENDELVVDGYIRILTPVVVDCSHSERVVPTQVHKPDGTLEYIFEEAFGYKMRALYDTSSNYATAYAQGLYADAYIDQIETTRELLYSGEWTENNHYTVTIPNLDTNDIIPDTKTFPPDTVWGDGAAGYVYDYAGSGTGGNNGGLSGGTIADFDFSIDSSKTILQMAELYLGYGADTIWAWTGRSGEAWCAAFVSFIGYKCGYIPELPDGAASVMNQYRYKDGNEYSYFPIANSVAEFYQWGIDHKRFTSASASYTPKAGDIIILDWDGNGNLYENNEHTGIVTGVDAYGNIQYIDGNGGGGNVARRTIRQDNSVIGFVHPDYDGALESIGKNNTSKNTNSTTTSVEK